MGAATRCKKPGRNDTPSFDLWQTSSTVNAIKKPGRSDTLGNGDTPSFDLHNTSFTVKVIKKLGCSDTLQETRSQRHAARNLG